jgi:hypothetical protein
MATKTAEQKAREQLRENYRMKVRALELFINHNAPQIIIDDARQKVNDARLRLWGWTGPTPRAGVPE